MTALLERALVPRSAGTLLHASDAASVGRVAAAIVTEFVRANPRGVLGVATGSSPEPVYEQLARARADGLRTEGLTLVALDEYVGLDESDPRGYRAYVLERIAGPLGIDPARVLVPETSRLSAEDAAREHERRLVELGGAGLQLAGIGSNGHLGFNEPGAPLDGRTRVVELAASTRRDNARYFGGDPDRVPSRAVTQGIGTILDAGHILLLARGAGKAGALRAALTGEVDPLLPASALQRHPRVSVVADHAALDRPLEN